MKNNYDSAKILLLVATYKVLSSTIRFFNKKDYLLFMTIVGSKNDGVLIDELKKKYIINDEKFKKVIRKLKKYKLIYQKNGKYYSYDEVSLGIRK